MLPQQGKLEIDPDERLEREAEETAEQVMRGGKIGVHRMGKSDVHVQRLGPESVALGIGALTVGKAAIPAMMDDAESMKDAYADLKDDFDGEELPKLVNEFLKGEAKGKTKAWVPGAHGAEAVHDEVMEQSKDGFQKRLQNASFPDSWETDLAKVDPPSDWIKAAKEAGAKAAENAIGSGNAQGVGSSGEVTN